MSDELTVMTPAMMLAKLQSAAANTTELEDTLRAANPFKIMALLKLSKDTASINTEVAGEIRHVDKRVVFIPMLIIESRALFSPSNDDENKMPICSTKQSKLGTFGRGDKDRGIGFANVDGSYFDFDKYKGNGYADSFRVAEGAPIQLSDAGDPMNGQEIQAACKGCPWNKYESKTLWEPGEDVGKGKACGETRMLLGFRAEQGEDGFYYYNDKQPSYMRLSTGSIRAVQGIIDVAAAEQVAPYMMAYEFSCEVGKKGKVTWAFLKAKSLGYIGDLAMANEKLAMFKEMIFEKEFAPEVPVDSDLENWDV